MSRYSVARKHKPLEPRLGEFTCRECSREFSGYYTYNRLVLCSEECRRIRYRRQRNLVNVKQNLKKRKTPQPRDCGLCGATFRPRTRTDAKYCTPKCYMRVRSIFSNYNLSLGDYKGMLEEQAGKCAACLKPFGDTTPFVDHNHDTGAVRGLVHSNCNTVLGFVNDDADTLIKLAEYLRRE